VILISVVHSEFCSSNQGVAILVNAKANFKGRCSGRSCLSIGVAATFRVWAYITSQGGPYHQIPELTIPWGAKPLEMTSAEFSLVLTWYHCLFFVILST